MRVNSLPKTVNRQRRGCDLNPGRTAPESSTLTSRLPRHPRLFSHRVFICVPSCANFLINKKINKYKSAISQHSLHLLLPLFVGVFRVFSYLPERLRWTVMNIHYIRPATELQEWRMNNKTKPISRRRQWEIVSFRASDVNKHTAYFWRWIF